MHIPDDVLKLVFEQCTAKTLARLECVSRHFRGLVRATPVQIHVTPSNHRAVLTWASRGERHVTKITTRRMVLDHSEYKNAQIIDHMYAPVYIDIRAPVFLQKLRKLRIHRLESVERGGMFCVSVLPDTLEHIDIIFGCSWSRVNVDTTHRATTLSLQTRIPRSWEVRRPDFLVTHLGPAVDTLVLSTLGMITVVNPQVTNIRKARIECEDNLCPSKILQYFGPALEQLVLIMPRASIVWSQDFAHIDPAEIGIHVDFAAIDVLGASLRLLEIRADRLAYIPVPDRINLWVNVRGSYVTKLT